MFVERATTRGPLRICVSLLRQIVKIRARTLSGVPLPLPSPLRFEP
jgi:hypothetical protein